MGKDGQAFVQEVTQAALAVLVVGGGLAIAIMLIVRGDNPNELPGWLELGIGAVLGFYYGAKSSNSTVSTMSNGPMTTIANLAQRSGPRSTDPPPPTTQGTTQ